MKTHGGATTVSDHSLKSTKPKSIQVSSKFLSPNSSTSSSTEYGIQSPNSILSPIRQKPRSSVDSKKHKSLENSGFFRGLWPSSSTLSPSKPPDTLADHLGNERLKDMSETKHDRNQEFLISRQRSCTGLSRFQSGKKSDAKENHMPNFGRFKFHGKSSKSSDSLDDRNVGRIEPGRFSVDGIALRNKSFGRGAVASDSESEHSDLCSGASFESQATGKKSQLASYMAPTMSSRKHGAEDPPKSKHDLRRWSAESIASNPKPFPPADTKSPRIFTLKNSMKKNGSKWAMSPGRSGSPTAESVSSPKPPTSPSRGKGGVGNILTMGIELLKGKKSSSTSTASSPLGPGSAEIAQELRLLHNRLVQWRYANARAEDVAGNVVSYAERDFLYAWNSIDKLQHSVVQKKLQLQSERLEFKFNYILTSHMKQLQRWGNMEREHLSAVTRTKESLHAVVCRIPLVDGAKGEKPSVSFAVRHADDVAAAIDLKLTTCSPMILEKTAGLLFELAMVVTQEKQLLEECLELFRNISALEMQERSLKSTVMQSKLMQQHHILSA